jgi:hypothetical protein
VDDVPGLEVVPLQWAVQAMNRALERVRTVGWNDPVGAFAAIGETLWWVCVVHDHLRNRYKEDYETTLANTLDGVDGLLIGLRFARNRITHGVDEVNYAAATATDPASFRAQWTWKLLEPRESGNNVGHSQYCGHLAGGDVVETLQRACLFLSTVNNRMWSNYRKTP